MAIAFGFHLVVAATHSGAGLSPDSLDYLRGARSLKDGRGFGIEGAADGWKAETHLAPLFPMVLSFIAHKKDALYETARWLNATLFGLNTLLAAIIVSCCAGARRRHLGAFAGAAAVALSPVLVEIHSMVWSEPLFIALWFGCMLMVSVFLGGGGMRWLIAAAICAGGACVARYSAMSLILIVTLTLLMNRGPQWSIKRRLRNVMLFGFIACLPIAVLVLRNIKLTGNPADRSISFHPPGHDEWRVGMVAISGWLLQHGNRGWTIASAIVVALIAIGVFLWAMIDRSDRSERSAASIGLTELLLYSLPVYAGFLLCSVAFVDAHTVFDNRILCPVYIPLLLLTAICISRVWPSRHYISVSRNNRLLQYAVVVVAIGLSISETVRAAKWTAWARDNGLGYGNTRWQKSDLLHHARKLPAGAIIYSNAPDALLLSTDAIARSLPKVQLPGTKGEPASYRDDLLQMRRVLKSANAFIYYFHRVGRGYLVSEEQLQVDLHLRRILKGQDGNVYTLRLPPTPPITHAAPATKSDNH